MCINIGLTWQYGYWYSESLSEEGELVMRDGGGDGGAAVPPVRQQLIQGVRLQAGARQRVLT